MKFTDNRRSQIETALSRTANRCCSVRQRNYLDRVVVGTFQKRHDINLATAGEKAGKVNAVMLQNPQSTDVQTPVDSVPHLLSGEEFSSHDWKTPGHPPGATQNRYKPFAIVERK